MILRDIGMIAVSSPRSKAYLQLLVKNNIFPSFAIIMENQDGEKVLSGSMQIGVTK